MKDLITLILFTLFIFSCKSSKKDSAFENYVILNDDLEEIVVKYVNYQPCVDCIYEVYFNKIDPHRNEIVLYKGNSSLTFKEYEKNGRYPVLFTRVQHKKIYVYTGSEGYIKAPRLGQTELNVKKSRNDSFSVWVISDSLNTRKIDTLDNAYPFLPMPIRRKSPPPY
jgi:hypothetical protein